MLKSMSWKTSLAALGTFGTALSTVLTALTDGKPETMPDWNAFVATAIIAVGLFFARDNNKTSEQVGATK